MAVWLSSLWPRPEEANAECGMWNAEPAFAEATAWQAEDEPNAERPISNEEKEMVAPFPDCVH